MKAVNAKFVAKAPVLLVNQSYIYKDTCLSNNFNFLCVSGGEGEHGEGCMGGGQRRTDMHLYSNDFGTA